jgi:uncharacterized protein
MKIVRVTVARVYITEASNLLEGILHYLKSEVNVRGVSVFRAISGYGDKGTLHAASLLDLSLNLPIVVEFFDDTDKIKPTLEYLSTIIKPEHIIFWEANTNYH